MTAKNVLVRSQSLPPPPGRVPPSCYAPGEDRAISSYDYIGRRELLRKSGCSISLAWVGVEAAFIESGHTKVWGV